MTGSPLSPALLASGEGWQVGRKAYTPSVAVRNTTARGADALPALDRLAMFPFKSFSFGAMSQGLPLADTKVQDIGGLEELSPPHA